ncbi:MAG: hypothetical protein PHC29_07975 [Candidatus Omnitrophica bacterium]|nr:hypothetical protein [Candidatus Omnitrophota bacterium]
MAYHSEHSEVYHKHKKCVLGNNIEQDNVKQGPAKKLCEHCKEIDKGKVKR